MHRGPRRHGANPDPIGITYEQIVERVTAAAEENGFELEAAIRGIDPYLMDPDTPVIQMVARVANEITGDNKAPYVLSGGAHGIDEVVSIERLQRAMRIYARILLQRNEMDW